MEYWDFTWFDMQNDTKANIEKIIDQTGEDKIYYVGYSQGTTQLISGLTTDNDWYTDRLHRAVMLAPCFTRFYPDLFLQWEYNNSLATFREDGIYAIYGPNWNEDKKKICKDYDYMIC